MVHDLIALKKLLKILKAHTVICTEYPFAVGAILCGGKKYSRIFSWEHTHYYGTKRNFFWQEFKKTQLIRKKINHDFGFIKTQFDVRYYYAFTKATRLANRIIIGAAYPYGNSSQLPFIKQFFIGGNNSIRAFRSRSIGPGTYRDKRYDSSSFLPAYDAPAFIPFDTSGLRSASL